MPNRLAQESSPYLKQHANNPVDWYPWGTEALAKARSENKPILLSIGYSACHWCHVMEHESFENPETASLMNDGFINIKVDREERPDLDHIYQNVAQLLTQGGGWPLTVFLTPELKPFYGGTYFPPEDRYGRPGFARVLKALTEAYKNDPAGIAENTQKLTNAIVQLEGVLQEEKASATETTLAVKTTPAAFRKTADLLLDHFDWRHGGFGGAPKFPNTMNLSYLWRYGLVSEYGKATEAVLVALTAMAKGGIYDQLGGGFHRYSVDERWAVPHFEKMLYDNALLLKLYSEVLLAGSSLLSADNSTLYTRIIFETTEYLLREMESAEGGFYSTQDADTEGQEGKYFLWTQSQISSLLTSEEAECFRLHYGVTEHGNFEETNQCVLFIDLPLSEVARRTQRTDTETKVLIESSKKKLFQARLQRIKPGRDEKILASWNGLVVSGLAFASEALKQASQKTGFAGDTAAYAHLADRARHSAVHALEFIRKHQSQENSDRLFSIYKDGRARLNGYLDDYAFMAMGALDLSRFSKTIAESTALLGHSKRWVDVVNKHFRDRNHLGFYFTSDDHEALLCRPKILFDQAIPSGTAIQLQVITVLADSFSEEPYFVELTEQIQKLFTLIEQAPNAMGELSNTTLLYFTGPILVSGHHSEQLCVSPFVFPKWTTEEEIPTQNGFQVCHQKTCEQVFTLDEAQRIIQNKIRKPWE